MIVKQYLNQIKFADNHINNLKAEKDRLFTMATSTSCELSERVQSSGGGDNMEKSIIKMIEIQNEIDEKIYEYIGLKRCVIWEIETIENNLHYDILFKRYVEYKDFVTIAKELGYSYQYIINEHGIACEHFKNTVLYAKDSIK